MHRVAANNVTLARLDRSQPSSIPIRFPGAVRSLGGAGEADENRARLQSDAMLPSLSVASSIVF
jgi:hypothetical protein